MPLDKEQIVVTGAAGFIGSYFLSFLHKNGQKQLIAVDDFARVDKLKNLSNVPVIKKIDRNLFLDWLRQNHQHVKGIYHLGARTDTTEMDYAIHEKWNVIYSQALWQICSEHNLPLLYASSAATYGAGEWGYKDAHEIVPQLQPLNPYGLSKNNFDKWVLAQHECPPFWAGVKFFNVFGPNEYHKGRMASVIFHAYHQIQSSGKVSLFKSHRDDYSDGEQRRDFIYVEDVAKICQWLMNTQPANGLYNVGTGTARTFNDLVNAIFTALNKKVQIDYIDTPGDIREKYQYFTQADMSKLQEAGYLVSAMSLEDSVQEYVLKFLETNRYY